MRYFRRIGKNNWQLYILVLILLPGCSSIKYSLPSNQITFQTIGGIPIVAGTINEKSAYFIIDTGASVSILNEAEAKYFGFKCFIMNDQNVVGFGGESKTNEAFNCKVGFGPIEIRGVSLRTRDMSDFTSVIRQHENISISGIIGSDVLNRYKIVIDFDANTIIFKEKIKEMNSGIVYTQLP